VRVRPFSVREAAQLSTSNTDHPSFLGDGSLAGTPTSKLNTKGIRRIVKPLDDKVLVFDPPEDNPLSRFQKTLHPAGRRVKDMRFAFDRVFDEESTQSEVIPI
jgi:kinesin family protein 18/19